jgi:AcrR family transcriptional regulator
LTQSAVASQSGDRRHQTYEFGPLPGGHHGLSRKQIIDSQRERLLAAVAQEVAEHGYRGVTMRGLTRRAGVSTRDFYEHFDDKEECFLAAFDAVRDYLEQQIAAAVAEQPDWPHQLIAGLRAALLFLASEPDLARLSLVEPVGATPTTAIHFREAVLACIPGLARGRDETPDGPGLAPNTEDSVLGGIISLTTGSIISGKTENLPALLPDLTEFSLSPYLGADRAAELAVEARTSLQQ